MTELNEGQDVHVMRVGGAPLPATVLSVDGDSVLIRDGETGKRRSVDRKRVMVAPVAPQPGKLSRVPNYDLGGGVASPKEPPSRSARYLAFVRERSCCACAAPGPSDPHHWALKGSGNGGMGMKVDDLRTVPLCRRCHDYYHAHGHLPESSVVTTRILFLATQTDLLIRWIQKESAT